MLDLQRAVEFEHGVEAVEAVGFARERHVVPGRELLEIDPRRPCVGEAACRIADGLQLFRILEYFRPGLRNLGNIGLLQGVQIDPHHSG